MKAQEGLDKGVQKYIAQGREWGQKEYMSGCQKMEAGLDVIETKRKQIDSYFGPIKLDSK